MYKKLPIAALVIAMVSMATLVPATAQAFFGPFGAPFSGACAFGPGCGGSYAFSGPFGYDGSYGGYGYTGYGRPYAYSDDNGFGGTGYVYGYGPYSSVWYGY
jgi:hypothetical protein